jgi:hypothetical protein
MASSVKELRQWAIGRVSGQPDSYDTERSVDFALFGVVSSRRSTSLRTLIFGQSDDN